MSYLIYETRYAYLNHLFIYFEYSNLCEYMLSETWLKFFVPEEGAIIHKYLYNCDNVLLYSAFVVLENLNINIFSFESCIFYLRINICFRTKFLNSPSATQIPHQTKPELSSKSSWIKSKIYSKLKLLKLC